MAVVSAQIKQVGVRKGAATLAMAGFIEYALQFLLPVVLVRTLSIGEYGEYRVLWLITSTVVAFVHLNMPHSLFFFLARCRDDKERGIAVANVMAFLGVAGIIAGAGFLVLGKSFFNGPFSIAMPAFLGLWIFAYLLDQLALADGNPVWQSKAIIGLVVLRTLLLAGAAILSHSLIPVLYAMVAGAAAKALLVFIYARRAFGLHNLRPQATLLQTQIRYSLPFALAGLAFFLRTQVDQWIVTGLFSTEMLAVISIAASVLPISALLRGPVIKATLSRIAGAIQSGSLDIARTLVIKTNAVSTLLLFPLLGFLFACADEIVEVVYTDAYRGAVAIMRIYLVGLAATGACATGHLPSAIDRGRSALRINVVCLLVSLTAGLVGATNFGLAGAALGSTVGGLVGEIMYLRVAADAMHTRLVDLVPWGVIGKMGLATILAAILSQLSVGLGFNIGAAGTLLIQSVIYFSSLAIIIASLGLWKEIEAITSLKLRWNVRQ